MRKRILVSTADANDGCALYRAIGPMSRLAEANDDLDVEYDANPSWGKVREKDLLVVIRPSTQVQYDLMVKAKNFGVPIWVDFDDDLFSMRSDNPSWDFYCKPFVQKTMEECIRMAEAVSVSTKHLKMRFNSLNENIRVVPNAFDSLYEEYREAEKQRNDMVFWRGTGTHNRDLDGVRHQIVGLAESHPEILWTFLGHDPWYITEKIEKHTHLPAVMGIGYWKTLAALRPKIVIVPLADTLFNRSKSNIAAIEAAFCGAVCLAPDWDEWQLPWVINYFGDNFASQLDTLLGYSHEQLSGIASSGWEHVADWMDLDLANEEREAIIRELT